MNTKHKKDKDFDTIKMTRNIKEKISREIEGMSYEELKAYFAEKRAKLYPSS